MKHYQPAATLKGTFLLVEVQGQIHQHSKKRNRQWTPTASRQECKLIVVSSLCATSPLQGWPLIFLNILLKGHYAATAQS